MSFDFAYLATVNSVLCGHHLVRHLHALEYHEAKASGPSVVPVVAHEGLADNTEVLKVCPETIAGCLPAQTPACVGAIVVTDRPAECVCAEEGNRKRLSGLKALVPIPQLSCVWRKRHTHKRLWWPACPWLSSLLVVKDLRLKRSLI